MNALQNFRINLSKIPKYVDFNQEFSVPVDKHLAKMILEYNEKDTHGNSVVNEESKEEFRKFTNLIKNGEALVKYAPRYGMGRRYAETPSEYFDNGKPNPNYGKYHSGLCCFSRMIKNTIFKYDNWVDIDQVKGHVTILKEIADRNKKELPFYTNYLDNFDSICEDIINFYSGEDKVLRADVKLLFNKTLYGGGITKWFEQLQTGDLKYGYPPKKLKNVGVIHPIYEGFYKETQSLITLIYESNDEIRKKVYDKDKSEFEQKNRVMAYFCGIIENEITFQAYKCALRNGLCKSRRVDWGYDGFTIPQVKDKDMDEEIRKINEWVQTKTGFKNVRFVQKPYDCALEDVIEQRKQMPDAVEIVTANVSKLEKRMSEIEMSDYVLSKFPHWKRYRGDLYVFDITNGMWVKDDMDHFSVVKKYLVQVLEQEAVTASTIKKVITHISAESRDQEWLNSRVDTSLGYLLFKNGIYNAKDNSFSEGFDPNIVFFGRINHDYEPFNYEYIEDLKQRLFYNQFGKEMGDYQMETLSRGLMGDVQKKILFCLGESNSGKSTITKAFQAAADGYTGVFNAECFSMKQNANQDESVAMRPMLLNRFKRLLFSNELNTQANLNGNLMKKVSSGGDRLTGRTLGKEEEYFIMHGLTVVFANDISKITPYDEALKNRLDVYSYNKIFVDVPKEKNHLQKDYNLEKEFQKETFKKAFIQMMIEAYQHFNEHGQMKEPEGLQYSSKEWIQQDDDVMNTFLNDYDITGNLDDFVTSSTLKDWCNSNQGSINILARRMQNYATNKGLTIENKNKKVNGKSCKCWFGIKEKTEDNEGY